MSYDEDFAAIDYLTVEVIVLQRRIDAGRWASDPVECASIFERICELTRLGASMPNDFGTSEFWNAIGGGVNPGDPNLDEEEQHRHPPSFFYNIVESQPQYARRFHSERRRYDVEFINVDQLGPSDVENVFDNILHRVTDDIDIDDLIGLQINHPALQQPINIPLTKKERITAERLLKEIERVQQSKKEVTFDENMQFSIVIVHPPNGTSRAASLRSTGNEEDWFESHCGHGGCFVQIRNTDNLCLARAIVTARAYVHKDESDAKKNVYKTILRGDSNRNTAQRRLAEELMRQAGLAQHNGPCGIPELKKIQAVLKEEYQIKVFEQKSHAVVFQGGPAAKLLHLYLRNNHYTVITTMPGFCGSHYWCDSCNKSYNNRESHRSSLKCPCCYGFDCVDDPRLLQQCKDCLRYFRGPICFDNHKKKHVQNGPKRQKTDISICERFRCCKDCGKHLVNAHRSKHNCGYFKCRVCRKEVQKEDHQCFMQPLSGEIAQAEEEENLINDGDEEPETDAQAGLRESKEEQPPSFVFFDFETRQELEIGRNNRGPIYKHEPNLCIVHIVCDMCRSQPLGNCTKCGPNRKVFEGVNCLKDFCKWLFKDNNKKHLIAIAHNAKGFDGQFVIKYLTENGIQPKIINKGLELMCLSVGKVKLIDSLNFMPMPLAALPKAFGEEELVKGWFPHLFNRLENENYVGPWPDAQFYSPDSMKGGTRKSFFEWYEQQKSKIFNFRQEFFKYCESDVDILRRCALKFRDIFMTKTGIDPFLKSLTIAGACNRVFRQLFLKENSIGIVPHGGYRRTDKQSLIAIKWIKWVAHTRGIKIRHAKNMGEFKIGPYKVDGIHEKTVFEFHGCYFHGCPHCMRNRNQLSADALLTAQEAYERTIHRRKFIENKGYTVVEKWECQLAQELQENEEIKTFFDSITHIDPLDPRDAFFGGRTNAVKLHHVISRDEQGRPLDRVDYSDICSLYPFICKYGKFPLGHPQIITEGFKEISANNQPYEGVIKCRILPPRGLLHPVLPFRCNHKLTFPLCRTCAVTKQTGPCSHSEDERALIGSWVSLEIYKALEIGYKLLKVFEVWHYENVEQFDRVKNPNGGLFTDYINTFIKMKQQADGWPAWVKTEQDKAKYINDYQEREFVKLEQSEIMKNPGLRALSKLMLNSEFLIACLFV